MDKYLYPNHPVRCILNGPNECGRSGFLTNLILNIINEYKKYTSTHQVLHQDLYQKVIKQFNNSIPIKIFQKILNEEDIDIVIKEIVNNKGFEKSDSEFETYERIEELKFPQEYDDGGIIILDDLSEKQMKDSRV